LRPTEILKQEAGIHVVGDSAAPAVIALRDITAVQPDVGIVDAQLSNGTSIEVCRQIAATDATIRTLVLTTHDDDPDTRRRVRGRSCWLTPRHRSHPTRSASSRHSDRALNPAFPAGRGRSGQPLFTCQVTG
jgi:CheY-like chemotaxis protein